MAGEKGYRGLTDMISERDLCILRVNEERKKAFKAKIRMSAKDVNISKTSYFTERKLA